MQLNLHAKAQRRSEVAFAFFKYELKFTGSTGSFGSSFVGTSAKGKSKHTDAAAQTGRSGGAPSF